LGLTVLSIGSTAAMRFLWRFGELTRAKIFHMDFATRLCSEAREQTGNHQHASSAMTMLTRPRIQNTRMTTYTRPSAVPVGIRLELRTERLSVLLLSTS